MSTVYVYSDACECYAPDEAITFNQDPIPAFPVLGMSFSAPDTMNLTLPGLYRVDYTFTPKCVGTTLAVFLDDEELPGSRFCATIAPSELVGHVFFLLGTTDVPVSLTLRNVGEHHAETQCCHDCRGAVKASLLCTAIVVAT